MDGDPFDLDVLRVDPTDAQFRPKLAKPKKWQRRFIRFPWVWAERMRSTQRRSTFRLALVLLYEHWRTGGQAIVLSNAALEQEGLTRRSKWNALRELERLELVEVEKRPRKSPRVVLRHTSRAGP